MTVERILQEALDRLSVSIRIESMPEESRLSGGLCLLHGKYELYIAKRASIAERIEIMLNALRQLDTESIWLPPLIREMMIVKRS